MNFPQQNIGKAQTRKYRDPVLSGDSAITGVLDGVTTTEVVTLGINAKMITLQSSGSLAYNYTVSANGENFATGGSAAANALSSYNTHMVKVVTITRTGGSGQVTILASA